MPSEAVEKNKDTIQGLIKTLHQESGLDSAFIQDKVNKCTALLTSIPMVQHYHYKSPELVEFYQNFKLADYGVFHKIVMLQLIDSFQFEKLPVKLPQSIIDLYKSDFLCIVRIIQQDKDYIFDWSSDSFAKDIGICSYRLIPAGAQILELSGFPRRVMFKSWANFFKTLRFFVLGRRPFKPYFEAHTHTRHLGDFNPKGWDRYYVRIGQMLKLNPHIKGVSGGSWYLDPEISTISPRLKFLRAVPASFGAEIFYTNTEGRSSNAFAKSEMRLKLFEQGNYIPKSYLMIWSSKEIINFSDKNKELLNKE